MQEKRVCNPAISALARHRVAIYLLVVRAFYSVATGIVMLNCRGALPVVVMVV
jgi:hypothetical protein